MKRPRDDEAGALKALKAAQDASAGQLARVKRERDEAQVRSPECSVCLDKASAVVFMPCRHLVACGGCAPKLKRCPACRADVAERLDVFMG